MFKKTLATAAILGAFAGSAFAADVTLYGRIDMGLAYQHNDYDLNEVGTNSSFTMENGQYTSSRFGLKGTEEIGNGVKVAFVLENGFKGDSGELSTSGTLFDREATLQVISDYGTLGFGRVGTLALDAGSFGLGGAFSAMGTGWGNVGNQHDIWGGGFSSRYDNMISYASPEFSGARVYAQYSFGQNSSSSDGIEEGKSSTNRYSGIGITYKAAGFDTALVVDMLNNASWNVDGTDIKDTYRVILGGSYDFGMVKPYVAVSYLKNSKLSSTGWVNDKLAEYMKNNSRTDITEYYFDGFGAMIGASAPLFGGSINGTVGYLDVDSDRSVYGSIASNEEIDLKRWLVAIGYDYKLSSRTTLYGFAGWMQDQYERNSEEVKPSAYQIGFGMAHYF